MNNGNNNMVCTKCGGQMKQQGDMMRCNNCGNTIKMHDTASTNDADAGEGTV